MIKKVALAVAALVAAAALVAGSASSVQAAGTLTADNYRSSSGDVVNNSVYDYAPSVMQDGMYRMWWCGAAESPGDNILYAESTSLDGPFHARNSTAPYQVVFKGTNNGTSFDSTHTCDPSVLRVNGVYYMYYGGLRDGTNQLNNQYTAIGIASSSDGISWT